MEFREKNEKNIEKYIFSHKNSQFEGGGRINRRNFGSFFLVSAKKGFFLKNGFFPKLEFLGNFILCLMNNFRK